MMLGMNMKQIRVRLDEKVNLLKAFFKKQKIPFLKIIVCGYKN